jgi:hypothetical protein
VCAAAANPQLASQAALARMLGVSRQAINDLIKRQIIPIAADGRIDVELARVAIANRVRPSGKTAATTPPPAAALPPPDIAPQPDATLSYHVAKTLREAAEAKMAQLKLAEMRGDLVRASVVRAAVAKRAAGLRESLLQLPARVVPMLVASPDAASMDQILRAEIVTALAQLTESAE